MNAKLLQKQIDDSLAQAIVENRLYYAERKHRNRFELPVWRRVLAWFRALFSVVRLFPAIYMAVVKHGR